MELITVKGIALAQLIDQDKFANVRGVTCPAGTGIVKTPVGVVWVTFSPVTAGGGYKRPHSKTSYSLSGKKISANVLSQLLSDHK